MNTRCLALFVGAKKCESTAITKAIHYRKRTRLHQWMNIAAMAVLLMFVAREMRAQSALDGFDPQNLPRGVIYAMVVQTDGKILVGGDEAILFRLNLDGTLDTAFNPNPQPPIQFTFIHAIALQADGKILVGGTFSFIGGQARNGIARLDPATGLADSFDPNAGLFDFGSVDSIAMQSDGIFPPPPSVYVGSIAVQADGKILVGGYFAFIGGQARNSIARLDPTTGLADSFNPPGDQNPGVGPIKVQADGKILAVGNFSIGGQTRYNIARLDPTTGLADSFNPRPNDEVDSIAVQPDGKVLVSGYFTSIGGQQRAKLARLDATTGLADSFNANVNAPSVPVRSIALQSDGKILAVGDFYGPNSIGGQTRTGIARLDATTGLADSFDPNPSYEGYPGYPAYVGSVAVQPDGKIFVAGGFDTFEPNGGPPVTRNGPVARLEIDGRVDQTLNLNAVGSFIAAIAVQPDGKTVVVGGFTTVLGVARSNIAQLNTDGTLDMAFDPNPNDPDPYGSVNSVAVQADGKILAGGTFASIGGQMRNRIARLDATTGAADSFDPNANDLVVSIAVQADGKILVGGFFTSIGGQPRNHIARLDATTGLPDSFNPNPNSYVSTIAVQADGKILVGGVFSSIGGQTRNRIARLDATTGLADSFNPNANNVVNSLAVQPDGKILVGGAFTNIGGQPRNSIARLDATTGLADGLNPNPEAYATVASIALHADEKILAGGTFANIGGQPRNRIARLDAATGLADSFDPNANDVVYAIAVQADGKILAGGLFLSIGGEPRNYFARLSNDTAALQDLAVTPTIITWTRGGSSPDLTRVIFEYSTDNVNYIALGNGIPQSGSSNWILTDLNLPLGQNFYVRARGYYRSGDLNGSESITESVRNAFLAGPSPSPTPTPHVTPTPHPPHVTPTPRPHVTPTPTPTPTPHAPHPTPTPTPHPSHGSPTPTPSPSL